VGNSNSSWRRDVLENVDRRDGKVYVFGSDDDPPRLAAQVAIITDRPLLLRGDPGVGKSSLAAFIARDRNWRYYEHTVTARTEATDLLWTFDAVRKLGDASLLASRGPGAKLDDHDYVKPGELWWAFDPASAKRRGAESDGAWNVVVLGHPNRFEDPAEASALCRLTARKLVDRGYLAADREQLAQVRLTGLLWFLWSSQKIPFLEPELVEGQAGTVVALLHDIAAGLPQSAERWAVAVQDFPDRVDQTLAYLDALPLEHRNEKIEEQVTVLTSQAKQLLDDVASHAPQTLASSAAFVTGIFAVKNRYSPLQGEDNMFDQLTTAVWELTHDNEARFASYLWKGFEPVRSGDADELFRWRWASSHDAGSSP
jgi:hypothetical protein